MNTDYLEINRRSWNWKTGQHIVSRFYDVDGFLAGKNSLNEIETNILGDVRGKSILHLQCHFGQDSLSLARLGAKVVGIDLSDAAIEKAQELTKLPPAEAGGLGKVMVSYGLKSFAHHFRYPIRYVIVFQPGNCRRRPSARNRPAFECTP